jgi:hypothetical protein
MIELIIVAISFVAAGDKESDATSLLKRCLASFYSERVISNRCSSKKRVPPSCWKQIVAVVIRATLSARKRFIFDSETEDPVATDLRRARQSL